jgi:hypothetical protein
VLQSDKEKLSGSPNPGATAWRMNTTLASTASIASFKIASLSEQACVASTVKITKRKERMRLILCWHQDGVRFELGKPLIFFG